MEQHKNFKRKILLPIISAMGLLLSVLFFTNYNSELDRFNNDVVRNLRQVESLFQKKLDSEVELLSSIIELLENNPDLQQAFLQRNREQLLRFSHPYCLSLEQQHRITHVYFYTIDGSDFSRVNNSDRYGDVIDSFTLKGALQTGKTTSGIEIGQFGALTLRVVKPWLINSEIVGFIAMGEDVGHLVQKLHDILNVEIYFSIYKKYLNRELWEEGMKLIDRNSDWDRLQSAVIVSKTSQVVPDAFEQFLSPGSHKYMKMDENLEVLLGEEIFRVGVIPLFDVEKREVGDISVLYNVTIQLHSLRKTMLLTAAVSIVISLALVLFFSRYLGGLEKELSRYQCHLEELVEERTKKLSDAVKEIKTLQGILPICAYCKQIRDDTGYWSRVEEYIHKYTDAKFSHSICPKCARENFPDIFGDNKKKG